MPDKNGANRGGARPGAGRKKKPLTERIEAGQKATVLKAPEVDALEMPKIKDYFKAEQRMGELYAAEVYQETWDWLKERGCATLINPMLLEQYAMSAARWVQLEGINSQYGFISKTAQGNATASPFVTQALAYMKQTNQLWYQIYQIVRENCSTTFEGTPQDDLMERLLRARDGENSTGGCSSLPRRATISIPCATSNTRRRRIFWMAASTTRPFIRSSTAHPWMPTGQTRKSGRKPIHRWV